MRASEHLVQFYDTEDELVSAVVPYLADGLDADETVLVIASEPHRRAVEQRVAEAGTDLAAAIAAGAYAAVDAVSVLDYMRDDGDGAISAEEFDAAIGALVRRRLADGRPLRVYTEIVALLWDRGETRPAIALEELWNGLRDRDPFMLFCGYPGPAAPTEPEVMWEVCRAHSCVLPAVVDDGPTPDSQPLRAEFMPTINAPARVRRLLRSRLTELRCDDQVIEHGTLTASELAANVVQHAHTPFRLLIERRGESIWIAIEDERPLTGRFDVVGRSPHGLGVVAALSRRWGVTPHRRGKVVWAEIAP